MPPFTYKIIDLICVLGIVFGIKLMSSPKTARKGNLIGATCMLTAVAVTMVGNQIISQKLLWISMAIGAAIGWFLAVYVTMTRMPQLVALLNGFGGAASAIVAFVVMTGNNINISPVAEFTAALAMVVGSITFSGSIVAVAKLDGIITPLPVVLKGHFILNLIALFALAVIVPILTFAPYRAAAILSVMSILISLIFGVLFAVRIGGGDMPITISLLNSLSGIAAATVGLATANLLVVAVGAVVGSAGIILTQIMCRAMNSSLLKVLTGKTALSKDAQKNISSPTSDSKDKPLPPQNLSDALDEAVEVIKQAENIIVVPGYGMALAQAQLQVKQMLDRLESQHKKLKFAIHPVAGRMPGHMNVLLAEVDVPYEKLCPMEDVNPQFSQTDLVIVVGANDVINPAARTAEGTPIYGMPVLNVDRAGHLIICNKDTAPGYAGVNNPLYEQRDNTTLILGDAADTLAKLLEKL